MKRCSRCGAKGLFLKLDSRGQCEKCAAVSKREKDTAEIEERAKKANDEAKRSEELLRKAKEEAKDRAFRELEHERDNLDKTINELTVRLNQIQQTYTEKKDELDSVEKKLKTSQNKIIKAKPVYQSMVYAMDTFMNSGMDVPGMRSVFNIDLSEVISEEPELKCLTMKNLRAKYRENEKCILKVTADYQSKYTTKSNATIYKLMVMALNAEINLILTRLSYGKLDDAIEDVRKITAQYYVIATEGNQTIVSTLNRFIGQIEDLYINAVKIEYEYYIQRERAKEEQRALREQMRQEAEERKALEAERKKVESEEKKYTTEMQRLQDQMEISVNSDEVERLKERIAELTAKMDNVKHRKAEIVNLQNGKAGTVYIISNLGSFGENVFKVGMTRRLEPQERVNELGDASVPFPFDVHSFIFSEDAPKLETELHQRLNSQRVNKVNLRKEFFNISLDEIEKLVMEIDPNAPFERTMLAEQYRQSLSITDPVEGLIDDEYADDEELDG